MSTLELQHYLINKISSIEDQKFLTAIQELIESADIVEKPYILSDEQHNAIAAAEENISKGNTLSHNEVMKRTKEWLKGK
jgi:hypothetical protein